MRNQMKWVRISFVLTVALVLAGTVYAEKIVIDTTVEKALWEVHKRLQGKLADDGVRITMEMTVQSSQEPSLQSQEGISAVRVESATYGRNCGAPVGNVTKHIAKQCNGKSECTYAIDYHTIGDPAPGCGKTYEVKWRCGISRRTYQESIEAEAGLGSIVILNCD